MHRAIKIKYNRLAAIPMWLTKAYPSVARTGWPTFGLTAKLFCPDLLLAFPSHLFMVFL